MLYRLRCNANFVCKNAGTSATLAMGRAPTRDLNEREKMRFRFCMDFEIDSMQEMKPANSLVTRFEV